MKQSECYGHYIVCKSIDMSLGVYTFREFFGTTLDKT